jgi:glutaredoxin
VAPEIVLHVLPPSHPCMTASVALDLKGLEYERVELVPGQHVEPMQEIYGEGNYTVPGVLVDGEPVNGSRAARLHEDLAGLPEKLAHVERIAADLFAEHPGDIPAGAFPAGWVPAA